MVVADSTEKNTQVTKISSKVLNKKKKLRNIFGYKTKCKFVNQFDYWQLGVEN